jgi:hypothetical protein
VHESRRAVRHRHLISAGSAIRAVWHPSGLPPAQSLVRNPELDGMYKGRMADGICAFLVVGTTSRLTRTRSIAGPRSWTVAISPLHRRCSIAFEITLTGRYDNTYALKQIEDGHYELLSREPETNSSIAGYSLKGKTLPRIITLGGDHTITLPLLRSMNKAYGPVSVIHFDSHL